ncbi:MAG: periplasmic binding family protein [Ramlibacter sp.]|jgi:branched-chain amino acid transport system substrate-binding protein|nr:periplasmic binding family protein [Ramlibacter sp.]
MLAIEGARVVQERFGKGKVITPEQARWGDENLDLTQAKLDAPCFKGIIRPLIKVSADKYGAERKLARRTGADCPS